MPKGKADPRIRQFPPDLLKQIQEGEALLERKAKAQAQIKPKTSLSEEDRRILESLGTSKRFMMPGYKKGGLVKGKKGRKRII